jgi:LuxR family transcriptional regulator, maltose regulon positive regulatory protein
VSHALRRASDGVGEAAIGLISDVALVSFNTIVSTWINDLADIDDDVYLFLDDYHRITDTEIRDSVSYLLRYAPTQFHLVLTATGEPSLPLARLRAHNQLLEIDTAALRFEVEETRQFLEQENIGGLEPSEVRLLHAKTEGWPAVLRIVAATLCQPGQDSAACGGSRAHYARLAPISPKCSTAYRTTWSNSCCGLQSLIVFLHPSARR